MRLIDADDFADFIKNTIKVQKYDSLKVNDTTLTVGNILECVIAELEGTSIDGFKNNPTIEPWKIGHWNHNSYEWKATCSECGEPCATYLNSMGKPRDRYCKWCGAKMEEGKEDAID
jgi:hypothetical protein